MEEFKDESEMFEVYLKENHKDIPVNNINKILLTKTLQVCEFDEEEATKLLRTGMKFRSQNQHQMKDRDFFDEKFIQVRESWKFLHLPKLTENGTIYSMIYLENNYDPSKLNFSDLFKSLIMNLDIYQSTLFHSSIPKQEICILDVTNISSFRFLLKLLASVMSLQNFLYYLQEVVAYKLTTIYVLNPNPLVQKLHGIFKPFLKTSLEIVFCANIEEIHEHAEKDLLPNEYGGKAGKVEDLSREYYEKLEQHAGVLKQYDNLIINQ